jgi:hypothetical protein
VALRLPLTLALALLLPGVASAQYHGDDDDLDPPAVADEPSEPGKAPAPAAGSIAPVDTAKPPRWLAVHCGELFTVTQGRRRDVTVLARDGKVVAIGERVTVPAEAVVVDARGRRVYPGLVAFETSGIVGQPPEDATDPFALNLAVALSSGITTVGAGDAVAKLTWGTLENHVLATNTVVKLDLGSAQARGQLRSDLLAVRERGRERRLYEQAKARGVEDAKDPGPLRGRQADLERMATGRARGVVAAGTRSLLLHAADLATEFKLSLIVVGGEEAWTVAPVLGRAGASVVVVPRSRALPDPRLAHPAGWTIENARRLHDAGVPVAVISASRSVGLGGVGGNDLNTLNLEAAYAVRGGLSEEAALEALTIVPARLLGVDDRVGSVEVGKDCDLIVTGGDLLHYETLIEWAIVDGRVAYDRDSDTLLRHVRPRTPSGGVPQLWPRAPGTPEPAMPEKER